jgi:hypothetical protein
MRQGANNNNNSIEIRNRQNVALLLFIHISPAELMTSDCDQVKELLNIVQPIGHESRSAIN